MVTRVLFLFIPLPMFWALFDQQVQYSVYSSAGHLCPFGVMPKHSGDTVGHTRTKYPEPSTITAGQPYKVLPSVWHRRMRRENVPCLMTGVTRKGRTRWEIRSPITVIFSVSMFSSPREHLEGFTVVCFLLRDPGGLCKPQK